MKSTQNWAVFLGGGNKIINATWDIRVKGYRPINIISETFPKYPKLKFTGIKQNLKNIAVVQINQT